MRIGVGLSIPELATRGGRFSPASLFTSGVAGAWYDPSDVLLNWRTNLLTYSQEFDNAAWTKAGGSTITANSVTAPDGTTTADTLVLTTGSGTSQLYQSTGSITGPVTASIWIRADSALSVDFGFYDSASDVSTFSVTTEWQRITKTRAAGLTSADRRACWLYKGTAGSGTVYIWGAQLELGSTATTYQAITTPEQTYLLYDPQPVLYQDSAGTTPVTAVEQPVGLMLDKSQGLAITPTAIDGNLNTATWTKGTGWSAPSARSLVCDGSQTGSSDTSASYTKPTGALVRWSFTISAISGTLTVYPTGGAPSTFTTTGAKTVCSDAASNFNIFRMGAGQTCTITDIRIEIIAGNHASQATAASRPVLRARYNLLTYSEQFDNAVWSITGVTRSNNTQTAPDGTVTAETITGSLGTNAVLFTTGAYTALAGNLTVSAYIKAGTADYAVLSLWSGSSTNGVNLWVNVQTGAVGSNSVTAGYTFVSGSSTAVGNGWYRIVLTGTVPAGAVYFSLRLVDGDNAFSYTNTVGKTLFVWGADLRTGSSAGTYQRIAAATDYATAGFLPYLALDGTDDSFGTNSIDFTATDKMSVCAGITKLSDASVSIPFELSANHVANAGSFALYASAGALPNYEFRMTSTANAYRTATTYTAPITNVLSCAYDIAQSTVATEIVPKVNGATPTLVDSGSAGTGNFGNYPLFIGRRNNTSFPFNGRIYQLIVCGKALSASELASTEAYVNSKTGAY